MGGLSQSAWVVDCDWDEGALPFVTVAIASVCVADDVVLPWCFSFMDVTRDLLSASDARDFFISRHLQKT